VPASFPAAGSYVENQTTTTQDAGFNVSGSATVGKLVVAGDAAVQGALDIGLVTRNCPYPTGANEADCSCAAGEAVVSGGTWVYQPNGMLRESRPLSTTTWRVSCTNPDGTRRDCENTIILCARLKP